MDYPQEKVKPYGQEGRKAEQVERMFDHIAPAYDRLNHLMSLGIDRLWRRRTGVDLSEGMMQVGRRKVEQAGLAARIDFQREDCEALTFADASFDAVTVAFGIRNFEHLDRGLREMCRVLRPGGHLVILELSTPTRFPMKQLFALYSKAAMPLMGRTISHDDSAYTYLPESIRAFPQGEVMQESIRRAGFSQVCFRRLTFGLCTLYMATK